MRFQLLDRRTSFVALLVRALVVAVFGASLATGLTIVRVWGEVLSRERVPATLARATDAGPSRVVSARGFVVGGLRRGARPWTPWHELGSNTVRALLAAEDDRFFRHEGFTLRGIARAALANRSAGRAVQGGSTITQQLAKSYVGADRTFTRKLTELAVARGLEQRFSKAEIFEAWVNRVYFGDGAEGITAAADLYFGVRPAELSLGQAALLASVVPAPSAFDPRRAADGGRARRDRVLARLEQTGLATTREVNAARAEPVVLRDAPVASVHAPGLERAVWRQLETELAGAALPVDVRRDGRRVVTSFDLVRQRRAERAVRDELAALDRRQGWRGPLGHAPEAARAEVRERLAAAYAAGAFTGELRPALVEEARGGTLTVWTERRWTMERDGWSWAVPFRLDAANHDERLERLDGILAPGDLVLVRDGASLAQWPRVEAAYVSADLLDGGVEALVGGWDAERSQFDRALQGCRQPGSTFKLYVYAAALAHGWTPATVLRDAPFRYVLGPFEEWRPRNADGNFQGHRPLWDAFVWSRNLPALQLGRDLGGRRIVAAARALGVESPLAQVASLALGASCVRPVELLRGYHTVARQGWSETLRWVRLEVTADGRRRLRSPASLDALASERLAALWEGGGREPEPALDRVTAFQLGWLLRDVVRSGTGADLRALGVPLAGKTGTTNLYDAWFAGYSARDAAVIWVGTDVNTRPLGRRESGGRLALPAWGAALLPAPSAWPLLAEPPPGVVLEAIDPETGELGAVDRYSIVLPFRLGTEPRRRAASQEELLIRGADRRLREF